MKKPPRAKVSTWLALRAETAADLMTPNPLSIAAKATIKEAAAFLTDHGFSAAPVIDDAGRPIGVVSQSDIVVHDREKAEYLPPVPEYYDKSDLTAYSKEKLPSGFQVENVDRTCVRDIMTPVVFAVSPKTPVCKVVAEMLSLNVHRLFVVDRGRILVGVISALDVVRHLSPETSARAPVAAAVG